MTTSGGPPDPDSTPEMPEWLDDLEEDAAPPVPAEKLNGHHVRVDNRPEVQMGTDIHRVIDEASEALAADVLVYHRACELVTVVGAPQPEGAAPIARTTPIIRPMNQAALIPRLTRFVKILSYKAPGDRAIARATLEGKKAQGEWKEIMPPPILTSTMLAAGYWPGVRELVGISETPFLRPDGTICQVRGYDEATGYLYAPSIEFPEIPDDPTQDQAKAALEELIDVFSEFPHVDDAARLVPIAAILTLLARPAICGAIPAFIFDASTRGSGKTLQAHAVSLIVLGRFASPCTFPEADDELEKVLASYAIAGSRIILLDNITRPFGGAPLDKALTARGEVDLRVLGSSEMRRLAWNPIVLASGNNVAVPEDTQRRSLVSRLESSLENPEDRTDVRDLPALCRAKRARLVAAGLTILRAYAAKGFPDAGAKVWGSFEEWSRLIPHALLFAGGANVLDAKPRGTLAAGDDLAALAVILRELPRLSPDPLTAKALILALWPPHREHDAAPDGWEALRDAIEVLAPTRPGMSPTPKALGEALRKKAGRVVGGLRLAVGKDRNHVRTWHVTNG